MVTLHKFKLLATQCTGPWTLSRSAESAPGFQFRRRKVLTLLLKRLQGRRGESEKEKHLATKRKLKELFLSSPTFEERMKEKEHNFGQGVLPMVCSDSGMVVRREGRRSFRQRVVRRQFRPVLVPIPE